MKLDVRYNEGKFTRFNLVCENKDSKSPYIVNLLVHYDLIEILKLNLIMAEVKKNLNESPENKAPYQVVTLDELEKILPEAGLSITASESDTSLLRQESDSISYF